MTSPDRHEGMPERQLPVLQLSSRQLILIFCVLLVLGAGLIVLGIQLGRWEAARKSEVSSLPDGTPSGEEMSETPEKIVRQEEMRPSIPHSVAESEQPPLGPSAGQVLETSPVSQDSPAEAEPRFVEVPAPPPHAGDSEAKVAVGNSSADGRSPSYEPRSNGKESDKTTINTSSDPSEAVAETRRPDTDKGPSPRPAGQDKPEEAVPSEMEVSGTRYSVQIAAVVATNRQRAEEFARENRGLNPELVLSEDGKFIRLLVGDFPDRKSAERRCAELRANSVFKDCFVRER